MSTFGWFLLAVLWIQYYADQTGCERITRPTKCSIRSERFKQGYSYEYLYNVTTANGQTGIKEASTGALLSCRLVVSTPRKCELILQILDCELFDKTPNQDFVVNDNSHRLAAELKRYPVYLQYNEGDVISHQFTVSDSEPQHIINIKRGIISILQLKVISLPETDGNVFLLHNIFGACQTSYKNFSSNSDYVLETYRDLLTCNLSHVSNSHAGFLPFIKFYRRAHRFSPITELMYPFELDVTCKYNVTPSLAIESALCVQRQVYHPWLSASDAQEGGSTQINQHIRLESKSTLLSRAVDHSLKGRQWVDLAMSFAMTEENSSNQDVMEELEQTVADFLGQGEQETTTANFPAASFRTLVDKMRESSEKELRITKDTVYACHNSSCNRQAYKSFEKKIVQEVKEKLFFNGLMSCGTDSCLAVFATCIRDGLLPDFEARSVVYNMGLFYQPSIKVVNIILEHCRKTDRQGCWLSLSAMVHRLTHTVENNAEMTAVVFETISHIHHMIGDKCRRGVPDNLKLPEKTLALEKLLIAIKAVANLGEVAVNFYHGKLHNRQSLPSTLLHCVKNGGLNFVIARSAALAIKSIGLQPTIVSELLRLVEDDKTPLALRTSIFDVLIEHNNEATLRDLLNTLDTMKIKSMQTYIMTRVSGIMESSQPELQELKAKLGKILKEKSLPQLDDNLPFRSHYTQFSNQFNVPLMSVRTGGYLSVNLIYAPTSSVFQSFTLVVGWILDNRTSHLFDVTVDLEGMDTFLDVMNKNANLNQNLSANFLDLLDILQKYFQNISVPEIPNFAHYSNKIARTMKEIFKLANIQKASFPYGHISLKVFGYEMGSISTNYFLMMLKKMHLNNTFMKVVPRLIAQGIQTMILRAFTPFDYRKVIPTVSGFPLETRVDSSIIAKTYVQVKTDMEDYIKHKKQILTDFVLKPSVSALLQVSVKVSVGEYTSSGISWKTSGVGMGDWAVLVKYLAPSKTLDLEHDIHMTCNLEQKPISFLNVRREIRLLHNDEEYLLSQPNSETEFQKCLPDIYTQVFGYRICLSGSYQNSSRPKLNVTSLLVNPFRVEGTLTPTDSDLSYYSLNFKYRKISQLHGYYATVRLEGPGRELSRQVSMIIHKNFNASSLDVVVNIPDAGITYNLGHISYSKNAHYHHKYSSVLSRRGRALSSFIMETKGSHVAKVVSMATNKLLEYNETKKSTHMNISFGALSFDLYYKDYVPTPTTWVTYVTFSYHCEPNLELLYNLHPDQHLAATQGHTSTFSYHQQTYDSKTHFYETWKGNNKLIFVFPGQNITMVTDMVADLQGAHRVTDLCWTYGNKTDFFHMNSSVHNQSTTDLFNFDYFLHLYSTEKFELDIEGHVRGPRSAPLAMLDISTDISFTSSDKKSEPVLSSMLSQLKSVGNVLSEEVASVYEATKSRLSRLWNWRDQTSDDEYSESKQENKQTLLKIFLESLTWNVAMDTKIRMLPHMISLPGGGKEKAGLELKWLVNASMPRGYNKLFMLNGSVIKGKIQSMKLQLENYIQDVKFNWEVEHAFTPEIFQHHHKWALEDTNKHSFDTAFSCIVNFEHPKLFEYDLILHSPWTNITHHINYTKISATDHTVRAFAWIHSVQPTFDLDYYESSNVTGQNLTTHMNLTSTYLDHHFYLRKFAKSNGLVMEGRLHLLGKLAVLRGERTLSMSLNLLKEAPPRTVWTYRCDNKPEVSVAISLLGPKKITVGVKTLFPNVTQAQNLTHSVIWSLELVDSRYLQHTVEFSSEMLNSIQNTSLALRAEAADIVKYLGDMAVNFILSDFKNRTLPFTNESFVDLLTTRLQVAMDNNPDDKMIKLYKVALGGVNTITTILDDAPITHFIKGSHIDKLLAVSVGTSSNLVMNWILHPPFFICQFGQIYIQPALRQVITSKSVVFSTPLPFVLSSFLKMPHQTALQKAIVGTINARLTGALTVHKDIAVILNGHTIKTFDGNVYHIAEPPLPSCTYLLGADLRHGQFGLTYTSEGVTVFSSKYGFTLAQDGSVFTIKDNHISFLPYSSPDGQHFLSLHNGELQLSFAKGLVNVTYNHNNDFYLIEIDRKLRNASIGLLGTNNHESGDDFLLVNGSQTVAEGDFQNNYELTKNRKCLVSSVKSPVVCKHNNYTSCRNLPAGPCQRMLNSQPFVQKCQMAECKGQSGCNAIIAYYSACRHQGIKVELPAVCAGPHQKSVLDLVIVQSLHHSVIRDNDPFIASRTLVLNLDHLNCSVGLVTFGGAGTWSQPKSHILNGKFMEKGRTAILFMHFMVDAGQDEAEADNAILAGAEYPFRSQATKVILLIHQRKPKVDKNNAYLLEKLKSRNIILVSASTYPELENIASEGILSTKDVTEHGGRIPSPQEMYSDVVTSTSGMWLDLDLLNSFDAQNFKKVAQALSKIVA